MAVIKANTEDVRLLARLMRAEAEGDGQQGMLLVGNVGVNRVLADCLDFGNIRDMNRMVFQNPGALSPRRRDTSISVLDNPRFGWHNGSLTGNVSGRRATHYGFLGRLEIARRRGITSPTRDVSRRIVSLVQPGKTVRTSINPLPIFIFREELS